MFELDPPFPEAEAGADLNLHTDMLLQTLTALALKPFLFLIQRAESVKVGWLELDGLLPPRTFVSQLIEFSPPGLNRDQKIESQLSAAKIKLWKETFSGFKEIERCFLVFYKFGEVAVKRGRRLICHSP